MGDYSPRRCTGMPERPSEVDLRERKRTEQGAAGIGEAWDRVVDSDVRYGWVDDVRNGHYIA